MKRYFIVHDLHLPTVHRDEYPDACDFGHYHYIGLDGHGPKGTDWNLLCLIDAGTQPCPSWLPLPPVFDQKTPLNAVLPYDILADLGIVDSDDMSDLLNILRAINPLMSH